MITGATSLGASQVLAQNTTQATSTDWAGSLGNLFNGLGSVGTAIGKNYTAVDNAFGGGSLATPQGSTSNVSIQSGGATNGSNSSSLLLYGAGFLLISMLGILAFKR